MSLNVVITMAGRGSRFLQAGYKVPKYEIMVSGKSLFDWSLLSLKNFINPDTRVIFVCLDANQSSIYVKWRCKSLGIRDVRIVELAQLTDGQATSAYMSRDHWLPNRPILIYNIDTFVSPTALTPDKIRPGSDGWIPCFQGLGEHWSFVKLAENSWAIDVAEKKRISNFTSIGLYWFAQRQYFEQAYERTFAADKNLVLGERYIATLYKQLIASGLKVSISELPSNAVHVLGTPVELETFLQVKEEDLRILGL